MTVDEGLDEELAEPPIETKIGQVYYIKWADGSESLFLMTDKYCYQSIAGKRQDDGDAFPIVWNKIPVSLNWRLVKKVKRVSRKNLPLYVSWTVNKHFTKLIQEWKP
jgi:hypothetical protein